jgi:hypothetical protein
MGDTKKSKLDKVWRCIVHTPRSIILCFFLQFFLVFLCNWDFAHLNIYTSLPSYKYIFHKKWNSKNTFFFQIFKIKGEPGSKIGHILLGSHILGYKIWLRAFSDPFSNLFATPFVLVLFCLQISFTCTRRDENGADTDRIEWCHIYFLIFLGKQR